MVSRSPDEAFLVVGTNGSSGGGLVKLCSYPALEFCKPSIYQAHSSAVKDVGFTADGSNAVSCGGSNDSSVIVWKLILHNSGEMIS